MESSVLLPNQCRAAFPDQPLPSALGPPCWAPRLGMGRGGTNSSAGTNGRAWAIFPTQSRGRTLLFAYRPVSPYLPLPGPRGRQVNMAWSLPSGTSRPGSQSSCKCRRSRARTRQPWARGSYRPPLFPSVSCCFPGCGLRVDDLCLERSPGLSRTLSMPGVPFLTLPWGCGRGDQNWGVRSPHRTAGRSGAALTRSAVGWA